MKAITSLLNSIRDLLTGCIRSVRITVGLVFGVLMLIGGLSVGNNLWAIRAQQHDALIINLAGRQRMLSQKMVKETWLALLRGEDPRRLPEMEATAHQFEEGLRALIDGGRLPYTGTIVSVPPATNPAFRTALEEVQAIWESQHRAIHALLESEPGSPAFSQGLADMERFSDRILEEMDEAVRVYQAITEAKIVRHQWLELGFLLSGAVVLIIGYRLIRVEVLRPVSALEVAVQRMEKGDLDHPVQVRVCNELGQLAQAFDTMRARVKARIQEQTTLLQLSRSLLGLQEPEAIARATFAVIRERLQPDGISLFLPDGEGTYLELIAGEGWTSGHVGRLRFPLTPPESNGLAWAIHIRSPFLEDHTHPDQPFTVPEVVRQAGVQVRQIVPMLVPSARDQRLAVAGVLVVDSKTHRTFSDDEVRFLSLIASQAAIALERSRQHQAVKEAEARYRGLFDNVPVGLCRATSRGQILDANPALVQMLGYPDREALLAANMLDFYVDPEERTRWQTLLKREGAIRDFEVQIRRRDGTIIWIRNSARAIRDGNGRVLYFEGAMEDITERKRAEEELQRNYETQRVINSLLRLSLEDISLEELLERALGLILSISWLAFESRGSVFLIEDDPQVLVMKAQNGLSEAIQKECARVPLGRCLCGQAAATQEVQFANCLDHRHEIRYEGIDPHGHYCVPILFAGRTLGVINIYLREKHHPNPREEEFLTAIANTLAGIIMRKRMEEALKESRQNYEALVNSIDGIVWEADAQTFQFSFVSKQAERLLGYPIERWLTEPTFWQNHLHPDDREWAVAYCAQATAEKKAHELEYRMIAADGHILWLRDIITVVVEDDQPVKLRGVMVEITERKRAEEEIRRRAAHQEALNAIITAAAAAPDLPDLLEIALEHILRAVGLEMGGIWVPPHTSIRGIAPDMSKAMIRTMASAELDIPGPLAVEDWQEVAADEPFSILAPVMARFGIRASLTVPIVVEGHRIGGLGLAAPEPRSWSAEEIALIEAATHQLGVAAERLRLLEKTREQARQVQQIMDTVPEGVLLLDTDGRIVLANPAAWEYLSVLTASEAVEHREGREGRGPSSLRASPGQAITHLGGRPLEELLQPPAEGQWHEVIVEGSPRRVFEVAAHPLRPEAEVEGWVLVVRDVTGEREIRRRIEVQERLAAVGQLAAGIAHDFNNIMGVIVLYAQMLWQAQELSPRSRERLETIVQQAKRAADLIEQILDFSRASVIKRKPLNLFPFLKELLKLLERTLPENIRLQLAYGRDDYMVNADPTRMQQVFMNLAFNARDAMPEGGELRIGLERLRFGPDDPLPLPEMMPGEWVRVTVSDTGTGIPPDVLPHIFEPFFTTKPRGQGTGLGLAQVYGIIKQHEGYIDVETRVGRGTTFTIYLPALPVLETETPELEVAPSARGSRETILVVEDDPATREALSDSLTMLNYRVLVAANGQEALGIFEEHGDEIGLVLSDLVMPEMGGVELFHALRQKSPAVKMVVLTGYPLEEKAKELRTQGIVGWLQKPLNVEQLAQAVKRALSLSM